MWRARGDGWGAWIRTREWRYQKPLPYRLATPQLNWRESPRQIERLISKARARSQCLTLFRLQIYRFALRAATSCNDGWFSASALCSMVAPTAGRPVGPESVAHTGRQVGRWMGKPGYASSGIRSRFQARPRRSGERCRECRAHHRQQSRAFHLPWLRAAGQLRRQGVSGGCGVWAASQPASGRCATDRPHANPSRSSFSLYNS